VFCPLKISCGHREGKDLLTAFRFSFNDLLLNILFAPQQKGKKKKKKKKQHLRVRKKSNISQFDLSTFVYGKYGSHDSHHVAKLKKKIEDKVEAKVGNFVCKLTFAFPLMIYF
jgi:hypothetical protein